MYSNTVHEVGVLVSEDNGSIVHKHWERGGREIVGHKAVGVVGHNTLVNNLSIVSGLNV